MLPPDPITYPFWGPFGLRYTYVRFWLGYVAFTLGLLWVKTFSVKLVQGEWRLSINSFNFVLDLGDSSYLFGDGQGN